MCGLDEWSGTQELVTALLADPLSSWVQTEALADRWKDRNEEEKVSISYVLRYILIAMVFIESFN